MYRFILFYFVLYICIYVAPWSCETRHLVPLYVHTCSGMTIKLNLTWLDFNSLMRSSISASLGGGLTASTTPQSVGKSKRWENVNLSVLLRLLLLTFCVWLPYFCFPSLWLYLYIFYIMFLNLTPFTDFKSTCLFSLPPLLCLSYVRRFPFGLLSSHLSVRVTGLIYFQLLFC